MPVPRSAVSVCQRIGARNNQVAAGLLAASQPGLTILDPLSASLLGVFLLGEHIRTGVIDLTGEVAAGRTWPWRPGSPRHARRHARRTETEPRCR